MKNLYVDPITHDLTLIERNLRLTTTTTEWLSAKIEAHLKRYQGEWFLNNSSGIPYIQDIFTKDINIADVTAILSEEIRSIDGVEDLVSFEAVYNAGTRLYNYTFTVIASSGETVEGGV